MINRPWLAAIVLLAFAACTAQDTRDLMPAATQTAAVESLRQDIASLRSQVADLENSIDGAAQPPAETAPSQADGPLVTRMDALDARLGELEAET